MQPISNTTEVWERCLSEFAKKLNPQLFSTWLKPINLIGGNENSLELEVPNKFFSEWIKDKYQSIIVDTLRDITNRQYSLNLRISKENTPHHLEHVKIPKKASTKKPVSGLGLNPKYTFENFVVGKGNEFAHAACLAVANHLSSKYNPLFIYGGVGLGKTHLLQAIGYRALKNADASKICYYTSEKFMNEFIKLISQNRMTEFRKKFRNADVLLIDDIQFWAGKERTQEEFFHTFNTLYESHKQIIVTSDKYPKEIAGIEERLRSRFEWGLVADIQPPDTETKIAIVKKKAEVENVQLPDDVALYLASIDTSNIRELEGYIIRIGAVSSLTGQEITLHMAKDTLKRLLKNKKKKIITLDDIQKTVASYFSIKVSDIKSKKRPKNITVPRQIAMYIARDCSNASFPEIGASFGGKDHSTVIHAFKKVEKDISNNPDLRQTIATIKKMLENC